MAAAAPPRLTVDKRHTASNSVAYNSILDHVLTYAGNYPTLPAERTVARATRATNAQSIRTSRPGSSMSLPMGSPSRTASIRSGRTAAAEFTTGLVNQIAGMGTQTGSLSLAFVNNFLRQCFTPELELVDFPQALAALDYLADLEMCRKKETNSALKRLGVSRGTLQSDVKNFIKEHPSIAAWIKEVEPSERKVEAMYTQLYVGLRRWILVNEFSLRPFNPHNCLAMLNTLFPPPSRGERGPNPTPALTQAVLHKQRETYVAYMSAVESRGTDVLQRLIDQNKRPGEETGWPAVRETLDNYLRVTSRLVDEARAIDDWTILSGNDASCAASIITESKSSKHQRTRSGSTTKPRRKHTTDSGVGFDDKSQSDRSSGGSMASRDIKMNSNPPSPPLPDVTQYQRNPAKTTAPSPLKPRQQPPQQQAPTSTLEKIANQLRKFTSRNKNSSSRGDNANKENHSPSRSEQTSNNSSARTTPPPPPPAPATVFIRPQATKPGPARSISHASTLATNDASDDSRSFVELKNQSRSRPTTASGDKKRSPSPAPSGGHDARSGRPTTYHSSGDRKRERSRSGSRGGFWGAKKVQAEPASSSSSGRRKTREDFEAFPYDRDEMMRQRAIYEAKHGKEASRRK